MSLGCYAVRGLHSSALPDDWGKSFCWKRFFGLPNLRSMNFPTTGVSRFVGNPFTHNRWCRQSLPDDGVKSFCWKLNFLILKRLELILPDDWVKSFCWKQWDFVSCPVAGVRTSRRLGKVVLLETRCTARCCTGRSRLPAIGLSRKSTPPINRQRGFIRT